METAETDAMLIADVLTMSPEREASDRADALAYEEGYALLKLWLRTGRAENFATWVASQQIDD